MPTSAPLADRARGAGGRPPARRHGAALGARPPAGRGARRRSRGSPRRTLLCAGGRRPATAAELGLTGDRPAGVLPATVAKHLLEAGVPPLAPAARWSATVRGPARSRLASALGADGRRTGTRVARASPCRARDAWPVRGAARRLLACDAVAARRRAAADPQRRGRDPADAAGVTYVEPAARGHPRGLPPRRIARAWLDAQARRSA